MNPRADEWKPFKASGAKGTMTRQRLRQRLYREEFEHVSRDYPGEPRANRKRIARSAAKRRWLAR